MRLSESIRHLPVCTSPKFPVTGTSADIDRHVKQTLQTETSVYAVDSRQVDELRPDVIVTQAQCEVFAVSLRDVQAAVATMKVSPRIVSLNPNSLVDVWNDIRAVAMACGVGERGEDLVADLQQRMAAVAATRSTRLTGQRSLASSGSILSWPRATGCRSWSSWPAE